ncbi:unnamed protein product [Alopecurus aequalis]
MKDLADKKRTERTFTLGEEVFIKLQPHVQNSVLRRSNNKLAFRYFGPYKVNRCINPVAYEMDLPAESKIHPVFHVSQMRKFLRPGTPSSITLPVITDIGPVPVKILSSRWHNTSTGRHEQVQVQWPPDCELDITWEDKIELKHKFPEAEAWGQASSQGGGDVSDLNNKEKTEQELGLAPRVSRSKRMGQPNRRHLGPEWTK